MPNTSEEINENDFVLKHRIAGAAFLLFFGALVLPWLLGPPSEAKKEVVAEPQIVENTDSEISEDLESEILAELQETIEDDEQVYISKITPDGKVSELVSSKDKEKAEKEAAAKAKAVEEQKQAAIKDKKLKEQKRKDEELAKANKQKEQQATAKAAADKAVEEQQALKELSEKERKRLAEAELSAALESESKSTAAVITSGWVVQVGMFVDKKKANNVFDELGDKGFKPSTSVVDTNLGLKTGTRVWLGPFAERQDAVEMKTKLANKTGTSGFIRAYP